MTPAETGRRKVNYVEEKDLKRIKARITHACYRFGLREEVDDVFQTFFVSGRRGQTIDQFVVDYLRRRSGRKGMPSYDKRQKLAQAKPIEDVEYKLACRGSPELDMEHRGDFFKLIGPVKLERDREIAMLFYYWGYLATEIGDFYKVSESRVSQILKRVQGCVSTGIAQKARGQRERALKVAEVGEIETEEISLGAFEGLAFKEPREVARLDEARFEQWIA